MADMLVFSTGDSIIILENSIIKEKYWNKRGEITGWVNDNIYTVKVLDENKEIVLRASEMKKA